MDNVEIIGFNYNILSLDHFLKLVNDLNSTYPDSIIQFLDASCVGGYNHVLHGINQSFLAFSRGQNLANDLSIEILLRISSQRQISKAFKILGIHEGEMDICGIFINCPDEVIKKFSVIFNRDDNVFIPDELRLQECYNLSSKEIANINIEDLLIDKTSKFVVDY